MSAAKRNFETYKEENSYEPNAQPESKRPPEGTVKHVNEVTQPMVVNAPAQQVPKKGHSGYRKYVQDNASNGEEG